MLFKYPKPLRFDFGQRMKGRQYLPDGYARALLSERVIVEEKMAGRLVTFKVDRFILCAQDMKCRRTLLYRVPARFAVFDVFEPELQSFRPPGEKNGDKNEVVRLYMRHLNLLPGHFSQGIFPVPLMASGLFAMDELPRLVGESKYAVGEHAGSRGRMAGIVVKPDRQSSLPDFISGVVDDAGTAGRTRPPGGGTFNLIDHSLLEFC